MILKLLLNTPMLWIKFVKISFVFDNIIADMLSNKKPNPVVTKLFIRGRKLNISLVLLNNVILLYKKNFKFYKLFSYENSKQTRALINCI